MNRVIALTKILFKTGFDLGSNKGKASSNRDKLKFLLIPAFLPLFFMVWTFTKNIYNGLEQFGNGGLILELGFYLCSMVIFMFGILYVMSIF